MTFPLHNLDIAASGHREDLLREAAMDRLIAQLPRSRRPMNAVVAAALRAIADHLDHPVALQPAFRRA